MSKKSIAKKLFWNIAESSGDFHPSGEEYEEARKKRDEAESKLTAILPEGFGLQLTAEAYTKNKNSVTK